MSQFAYLETALVSCYLQILFYLGLFIMFSCCALLRLISNGTYLPGRWTEEASAGRSPWASYHDRLHSLHSCIGEKWLPLQYSLQRIPEVGSFLRSALSRTRICRSSSSVPIVTQHVRPKNTSRDFARYLRVLLYLALHRFLTHFLSLFLCGARDVLISFFVCSLAGSPVQFSTVYFLPLSQIRHHVLFFSIEAFCTLESQPAESVIYSFWVYYSERQSGVPHCLAEGTPLCALSVN